MKSETSDIDLSIVSKFMKLYESGQESNKSAKNVVKVNKSTQSELNKLKKKKKNKSKEIETLELNNKSAPPIHIDGSSKKIRSTKKSKSIKDQLEVQRMNLVTDLVSHDSETLLDVSNVRSSDRKSKKRNKSTTTIQDDAEVKSKKVKSNDASNENINLTQDGEKLSRRHRRKLKKLQSKENQNSNKDNVETIKEKAMKKKEREESSLEALASDKPATGVSRKVKKAKKFKPQNEGVVEIASKENVTVDQSSEKDNTAKKSKKKKRKAKSLLDVNTEAKMDGEPAVKTRRQEVEVKPEAIAKDLEDLNIGDNAHTLSNLLDEMTVVDKNMKKDKQKRNKNKRKKAVEASTEKAAEPGGATEEEEKVKWHKRKWNKDKKGDQKSRLQISVLVENLPLKLMFSYKTLLSEHFSKFGTVAGVGVAEAYTNEEPKPVFTTTVYFKEEEGAEKALEEDNTLLEGNRIRVRRPLPPRKTTVVVKARAPLSDQTVSSALCGAGRIRSIRHLVKGKHSKSTAFVQFDGPEAVERALKMAEDVKISGKNIHVSRYGKGKSKSHNSKNENTANDGGDEGSND